MNIDKDSKTVLLLGKNSSGLFFSPTITKNAIKQIATEYFQIMQKKLSKIAETVIFKLPFQRRWFSLMLKLEKRNERTYVLNKKP